MSMFTVYTILLSTPRTLSSNKPTYIVNNFRSFYEKVSNSFEKINLKYSGKTLPFKKLIEFKIKIRFRKFRTQ